VQVEAKGADDTTIDNQVVRATARSSRKGVVGAASKENLAGRRVHFSLLKSKSEQNRQRSIKSIIPTL